MKDGTNGNTLKTEDSFISSRTTELDQWISSYKEIMLKWLDEARSGRPVVEELSPQNLRSRLHVELSSQPSSQSQVLLLIQDILNTSVKTWHPQFLDKLYAATSPIGIIAEMVMVTLNTNAHVYHVSPALSLIEVETARQFAQLFGFDDEKSGGLTFPGGSSSNLHSMITARNTLFPETKKHGNGSLRLTLFTSAHGHYSVEKSAMAMGLGTSSVRKVAVDATGRMDSDALERAIALAIEAGETPFYVNTTAGTTVLGSFDPFEEVATICQAHHIWMHIDGSWGGSVVFAPELRRVHLKGAELADSITVNPHKMLGVPLQCSFLLCKDKSMLYKSNSSGAEYLFHGENEYDLGDATIGCGRRPDAIKLFLAWKLLGSEGLANRVRHAYDVAAYMAEKISERSDMHLLSTSPPPCLQVCFWYCKSQTPDLRSSSNPLSSSASKVQDMTRAIHTQLSRDGSYLVDYAPSQGIPDFFRTVINSPEVTYETVNGLIEEIARIGKGL